MNGKAMSLKYRIRDLALQSDLSAQVLLQSYMFERFLERLSKSEYRDKFILKGGMLISSLVGIANRTTMDMDITIKNYPLNPETLVNAIQDICCIEIQDDVTFHFLGIETIRQEDIYGGFRMNLASFYDTIKTPMHIDITTGDAITPKEVQFLYKKIFENDSIGIWAYNVETVLAEKVETILRRGELNTRPRDFYDVHILTMTQDFDVEVFYKALRSTSLHRETSYFLLNIDQRMNEISNSPNLKERWISYAKNYNYASGITFEEIMYTLNSLLRNYQN